MSFSYHIHTFVDSRTQRAPVAQEPGCPENDRLGDGKGMKNMNKELTDVV
ncbi:hypothetical protein NXY28_21870 [Bacteroides thetaiotaomicron]|nr:hypothetical protein NXY28_21870 [Bacteroides thetaiotaomicron]